MVISTQKLILPCKSFIMGYVDNLSCRTSGVSITVLSGGSLISYTGWNKDVSLTSVSSIRR